MDPSSREDLSALMDGELAGEPTRFLLRRLEHDPELGATWSRWHLIRACLASDAARMTAPRHDADFASRIATALADERVAPQPRRHWAQYVGGGALAAGVAVAAPMLNTPNPQIDTRAPVAQSRPASQADPVPTTLADTRVPAANQAQAPWLMARQPTVLAAQPAAANVVYGTGLMQPEYLHRAAYAQGGVVAEMTLPESQADVAAQPYPIVMLPAAAASSASAGH